MLQITGLYTLQRSQGHERQRQTEELLQIKRDLRRQDSYGFWISRIFSFCSKGHF